MYYSAFILWFDHFLESGSVTCQIFRCFFGKFKTSERYSKINWHLAYKRCDQMIPTLVAYEKWPRLRKGRGRGKRGRRWRRKWKGQNFCRCWCSDLYWSSKRWNSGEYWQLIKFRYSKKATKIWKEISHLFWTYKVCSVKSIGEMFSNFCGLFRISELYIYVTK